MEIIKDADLEVVLWLNKFAGRWQPLDELIKPLVSDYLIPVLMALGLLWLWFSSRDHVQREVNQKAAITAIIALGLANLAILTINDYIFRDRPFVDSQLTILFYKPTDSSFPANPAALSFALSFSVWLRAKAPGWGLLVLALLWNVSRVYAGLFFPSDIAAGAGIGIAASACATWATRWLEPLPSLLLRAARAFHAA